MTSRFNIRQVVPPQQCLSCDVCCRFPEKDSFLAPYFTREEIVAASVILDEDFQPFKIAGQGSACVERSEKCPAYSDRRGFPTPPNKAGCKITLTSYKEGYICPAFNPRASHCKIYDLRPIDCKLYPFAVMWDASGKEILLGLDTKCPYVGDRLEDPVLREAAGEVASAIESEPLLDIFASNRGLIGPYQDDVFPLVVLKKLTNHHCEVALR